MELKKNMSNVFHKNITVLASNRKFFFFSLGVFLPFCHFNHQIGPKILPNPEILDKNTAPNQMKVWL